MYVEIVLMKTNLINLQTKNKSNEEILKTNFKYA
jgi:hypothetical protein